MPPRVGTKELGNRAESYAIDLLIANGYQILERNFRSRFGEIDIVAVNGDTLVFVEVKARWSDKFGSALEAVTASKVSRIKKTGEYYSLLHRNLPKKLRIDVVAIEMKDGFVRSSKIVPVY